MHLSRRDLLRGASALGLSAALPGLALAAETPVAGGVLTVHLPTEQRILNPALRASAGVYVITSKIFEALVDLGPNGRPVGVLATEWEAAPDGRSVTFRLRRDVTWHDGRPFTAADVQFTAMALWKKHLNYGTQLQLHL